LLLHSVGGGPHTWSGEAIGPGAPTSYSDEFRTPFTDRIAMRRMGTPDDIAHAVLFLASDVVSWITEQVLPVTGSPIA
jgi:NAD(P)-dependent dehydrogenase (short-subunit alcohol dehydrogenase family)